ncbi:MAG: Gfo/Idh/MocA family oxidoreductase [Clostridia bacterium]|nr:Gfo/Idh/MocA family oxidoreductase [Clostridia bacterium]
MNGTVTRFGILGCGLAAGFHANALKNISGACLAGVYDLNKGKRLGFAAKYGCASFESLEQFAESPDIDAVCVCTPSGYHADNSVYLMEHGKALLIEKPLATTKEQAKRIVDAKERTNTAVGVVSQLRCCQDARMLKDMLSAGELGKTVSVNLTMLYHRSEEYYKDSPWHGTLGLDGGGALINQGIHGVDLVLWLLGRVKRVSAVKKTLFHNIEAEDTLSALLEFENGAIGTLCAATSVWPGQPRTLTVCGTAGTAVLTEDKLSTLVTQKSGELVDADRMTAYLSHSDPGAIPPAAHENVIRDFCDALRTGRAPISDVYDGYNAFSLIDAIYKSSLADGAPVEPEYTTKENKK